MVGFYERVEAGFPERGEIPLARWNNHKNNSLRTAAADLVLRPASVAVVGRPCLLEGIVATVRANLRRDFDRDGVGPFFRLR